MLSVLILSQRGEGYEIGHRLVHEGHFVKLFIADTEVRITSMHERYQQVDRYQEHIQISDLVVVASDGFGALADQLRKNRKLVVGGTLQDVLGRDSILTSAAMKLLDVEYAEEQPNEQTVSLCGWFNGKEFWETFVVQCYERLLESDRGPRMQDMGCLAWRELSMITRLTPILASTSYRGFVGIELGVTPDDSRFKSFRTSISGGELPAIVELMGKPLASTLVVVASGQTRELLHQNQFGIAVKLLAFNPLELTVPEPAQHHYWPHVIEGSLGYISARGISPQEARRRVYRTISNSAPVDVIFRRDIGCSSIWEWASEGEKDATDKVEIY